MLLSVNSKILIIVTSVTYTNPKLVDPETDNFVACFEPDFSKVQDLLYFGTKEIDINYLYSRVDKLLHS